MKKPDCLPDDQTHRASVWSEIFSEQIHGSNGVQMTKGFLIEMFRRKMEVSEELRCDIDVDRTAAQRFFEESLPFANDKQKLWFGVQIRFDPNGPIMNEDKDILNFLAERTVVICMDQLYRHHYTHGNKAGVPVFTAPRGCL